MVGSPHPTRRRWLWVVPALALIPVLGCMPSRGEATATDRLTIGAYSVVREAFHDGVLPAFAAEWQRRTGRTVVFEESYNGSGAQSRAIASGFDADIAVLSLEGDIERLVEAGLVDRKWNAGPDRGIITRSLVVIGVRPGNPKSIHDWDDLARPGVSVLYPDPKTSGGARWNINAIYGAGLLGDRWRRPVGPRACSRGSRRTSSTWTPRAGRAWPPSSAGPATRSSPTRTSCCSSASGPGWTSPTSSPRPPS